MYVWSSAISCWFAKNVKYFISILCLKKTTNLFIKVYFVALKVCSINCHTTMMEFDPILHTFFIDWLWYGFQWIVVFEFQLVFEAPFRRLLACLYVILVNPYLVTTYTFHEGGVRRSSRNYVFIELFLMLYFGKNWALSKPAVRRRVSCPKYQS